MRRNGKQRSSRFPSSQEVDGRLCLDANAGARGIGGIGGIGGIFRKILKYCMHMHNTENTEGRTFD